MEIAEGKLVLAAFCKTEQIFAHVENKSTDMESAMTFKQGVSGNPHGNRHRTRHLLNQEFMQALLLNFRHEGKRAIEKVARDQPGVYLKILALLVPREMKVEHSGGVKAMTDEQIEQAIEAIQAMLTAQAGEAAKVIEGTAKPEALENPDKPRPRKDVLLEHVETAVDPAASEQVRASRGNNEIPAKGPPELAKMPRQHQR